MKSMGRIFIGLVKCGAWGCFDEFNRLEEAVLSAVSMQIQTIQASIKNRDATTELLEKQVWLYITFTVSQQMYIVTCVSIGQIFCKWTLLLIL